MDKYKKKLKSLLKFYNSNGSEIELKFLDKKKSSVVGSIIKIGGIINKYIVLKSNNGSLMKVFFEDIDSTSIFPTDFSNNKKKENRKPINPKLRYAVLKRDKFKCQSCGTSGKYVELEVDHIHPVSKGGTDDMDNLQTLCFDCNRGKGDL